MEFVDRGVSGSKDKRPALDELVKAAKRRKFDVLVCWRLDRLGRNLRHLILLLDELQALGVAFVSLAEGIDATTPAGRPQLHVVPRTPRLRPSTSQAGIGAKLVDSTGSAEGQAGRCKQEERRLANLIEFIAEGRGSRALAQAVVATERRVDELRGDLETLRRGRGAAFEAPPLEWLEERIARLQEVLERRTAQSALLLRKLLADPDAAGDARRRAPLLPSNDQSGCAGFRRGRTGS